MARKSEEEKYQDMLAETEKLEAKLPDIYEKANEKAKEEVKEAYNSLVEDLGKALNVPKS